MDERDWEGTPRSLHGFCCGSSHSIPTESLIRKRLQCGVTYCPLSATQHTIGTKPGSSSQTTKATARKSMALIGKKLMLDTEQTGSGYLTAGQNQKNTTPNKNSH